MKTKSYDFTLVVATVTLMVSLGVLCSLLMGGIVLAFYGEDLKAGLARLSRRGHDAPSALEA